jgi:hypothetical protein
MEDTLVCMEFEVCTVGGHGSGGTKLVSVYGCRKGREAYQSKLSPIAKELVLASPEGY